MFGNVSFSCRPGSNNFTFIKLCQICVATLMWPSAQINEVLLSPGLFRALMQCLQPTTK